MNDIATNLFAVVIVLGFLIFAHEAGHFMFAKLFRGHLRAGFVAGPDADPDACRSQPGGDAHPE